MWWVDFLFGYELLSYPYFSFFFLRVFLYGRLELIWSGLDFVGWMYLLFSCLWAFGWICSSGIVVLWFVSRITKSESGGSLQKCRFALSLTHSCPFPLFTFLFFLLFFGFMIKKAGMVRKAIISSFVKSYHTDW